MILECPACYARYVIPDQSVGAEGRNVRCAKCKHEWFTPGQSMPAPAMPSFDAIMESASTEEAPKPRPTRRGAPVAKPMKKGPSMPLLAGAAAALLVAFASTLLYFLPATFGYKKTDSVMLSGLTLDKQETDRGMEYAVKGAIINTSEVPVKLPILTVTFVDEEGAKLQFWELKDPNKVLEPKENMPISVGPLKVGMRKGTRFVIELGNPLELMLRSKPEAMVIKAEAAPAAKPEEKATP